MVGGGKGARGRCGAEVALVVGIPSLIGFFLWNRVSVIGKN